MIPEEIFNKKILIASLNWGMGHVARCIPLITKLINQNNDIWIACSKEQKSVYVNYFSDANYLDLDGFPFKFSGKGYFTLDILLNFPLLYIKLYKEKKQVNKWMDTFDFDLMISDQRYSFRSKKCHSVLLTHQINLPKFRCSFFFRKLHNYHLNKFNQIWVCDFDNSSLAGELSRNTKYINVAYIGPLSRFDKHYSETEKNIDSLLILSGPQSYHDFLLEYFLDKLNMNQQIHIISPIAITKEHYERFPILNKIQISIANDWSRCDMIISKTKKITSYSGYSTIMDLFYLNIKSDLIATPGQKEQLYLHKFHSK